MSFLEMIQSKQNLFIEEIEQCKRSGFKTYIYGAGMGGYTVERRVTDLGMIFAGKVVNREYYKKEAGIFSLEDLLDQISEKINLIIAFRGFCPENIALRREKINLIVDRDCFAANYEVDPLYLTYEYVEFHRNEIEGAITNLADEKSKKTVIAYINQKISMDYQYLKDVKSGNQYFEKDIVQLGAEEVFIDCGAYDGDSAVQFIAALEDRGIKQYKEIISFEPDPVNYKKLIARKLENHKCINKASSDRKGKLSFSANGTSSLIDKQGVIVVETETIDNVLAGRNATFIKMDIEGAELASLRGAEKTIKKHKPKLAICIYHRREDLWEIQQYIHDIVPEYKFYIRAYESTATELVLYAIAG